MRVTYADREIVTHSVVIWIWGKFEFISMTLIHHINGFISYSFETGRTAATSKPNLLVQTAPRQDG